jgi:beta-glucanase (GH16 family)
MVTRYQGDWTYGRIEVRAKLPGGVGTWPAIWMLPTDWVYGGWPSSGEIDIMEHVGFNPNVIHGTAHTEAYNWWNGSPPPEGTIYLNGATSSFHDYALEWDKDYLKWYVDDVLYFTYAKLHGFPSDHWHK